MDAQGPGEVIVHGSVQEMFRCCTKGHGIVRKYGWTVRLDDLGELFQHW